MTISAITLGQRVLCNGYTGFIVAIHAWANMVDVRLPGGVTCVCATTVEPAPIN